jgi:hypothetical protein
MFVNTCLTEIVELAQLEVTSTLTLDDPALSTSTYAASVYTCAVNLLVANDSAYSIQRRRVTSLVLQFVEQNSPFLQEYMRSFIQFRTRCDNPKLCEVTQDWCMSQLRSEGLAGDLLAIHIFGILNEQKLHDLTSWSTLSGHFTNELMTVDSTSMKVELAEQGLKWKSSLFSQLLGVLEKSVISESLCRQDWCDTFELFAQQGGTLLAGGIDLESDVVCRLRVLNFLRGIIHRSTHREVEQRGLEALYDKEALKVSTLEVDQVSQDT